MSRLDSPERDFSPAPASVPPPLSSLLGTPPTGGVFSPTVRGRGFKAFTPRGEFHGNPRPLFRPFMPRSEGSRPRGGRGRGGFGGVRPQIAAGGGFFTPPSTGGPWQRAQRPPFRGEFRGARGGNRGSPWRPAW